MTDLTLIALSLSGLFLIGVLILTARTKTEANLSLRREKEHAVTEATRLLRLSDRTRAMNRRSSPD